MTKDELIHTIRMIAQGRPNFAEALADHLMPDAVVATWYLHPDDAADVRPGGIIRVSMTPWPEEKPVDLSPYKDAAEFILDNQEALGLGEKSKSEMVEIEVEPSPTSWAGLEKARADVVAEYFAPEPPPPDPAPAKPKRKKA